MQETKLPSSQGIKPGAPVVVVPYPGADGVDLGAIQKRIIHRDGFHAHEGIVPFAAYVRVDFLQGLKVFLQQGQHEYACYREQGGRQKRLDGFPCLQAVQYIGGKKNSDKGDGGFNHRPDAAVDQEPFIHLPYKFNAGAHSFPFFTAHFLHPFCLFDNTGSAA